MGVIDLFLRNLCTILCKYGMKKLVMSAIYFVSSYRLQITKQVMQENLFIIWNDLAGNVWKCFHNEANPWENWELDCVWIPFPWKKSSPSSLILQFSWCIYVFLSCIVHKIQCEISKVSILGNNSIFCWERNSFFNKFFSLYFHENLWRL